MIVILDNNAYRDLVSSVTLSEVDAVVGELGAEQYAHGHLSVASPIVAMELLARLRDPGTPAFEAALKAIVALVRNCEDSRQPVSPIRIRMDPDADMCLALFHRLPPDAQANIDQLTWLLKRVTGLRGQNLGQRECELVQAIADHVDTKEQSFISDTFKRVVKPLNPDIGSWEEFQRRPDLSPAVLEALSQEEWSRTFARVQVLKAADALGLNPTEADIEERTTWLRQYVKAPFALYTEVMKRVIVNGARLTAKNRANWFWDIHILFGVGREHTTENQPILLVTSDADMVDAATKSGAGTVVASYEEYRRCIAQTP